jgi:hypothetical protein
MLFLISWCLLLVQMMASWAAAFVSVKGTAGTAYVLFIYRWLFAVRVTTHSLHVLSMLLASGPYSSVCHKVDLLFFLVQATAGLILIPSFLSFLTTKWINLVGCGYFVGL